MSFRLLQKSVTLNDLKRRNGPYFASFHRIRVYDVVVKKFTFASSSPDEFLVRDLFLHIGLTSYLANFVFLSWSVPRNDQSNVYTPF